MSGRSHVDVNERRLRPIYDCLDNGNNKKAIQEADRLLKKQKDLPCAKALKSLAMIRLGRQDETVSMLQEVHAQQPFDDATMQALSMCYRDMYRLDLMADMYEKAVKSKPDNEELLNSLFMAYVRLGNYKKQQQVGMSLHKLRPHKNPYYFWAVMSIVMQAHDDKRLGLTMYLPLAEKMTLKYLNEGKLDAEAEVRLYLIILQNLGKYSEALAVLKGPLAVKLTSEPDFCTTLEGELLVRLQLWPRVNTAYRKQILANADNWQAYQEYLNSAFELIDIGWTPDDHDASSTDHVDYTVDMVVEFIKSRTSAPDLTSWPLRGPYLAQFNVIHRLRKRQDERWNSVFGDMPGLFREYFARFGDKPCCYADVKLYADLLTDDQQSDVLSVLLKELCVGNQSGEMVFANSSKAMQRHMMLLQWSRLSGAHHRMTNPQRITLANQLLACYDDGLKFGDTLLPTDIQYADNYLLLVVHLLNDVAIETGNEHLVWRAIVLLEGALKKSPTNFQLKILLLRLYTNIGAVGACVALSESLDIKHILLDALGFLVSGHTVRFGHFAAAELFHDGVLRFFASIHKDTSEYLIHAYKFGSFNKVNEFVEFRERLQNSLQFASSTVEKLLLDLVINTDSHTRTRDIVINTDIDPRVERTDFEALRDNRDWQVQQSWDPHDRAFTNDMTDTSFKEEKAWLQLRNVTARSLLACVRLSDERVATSSGTVLPSSVATPTSVLPPSGSLVNNSVAVGNGGVDKISDYAAVMRLLRDEFVSSLEQCQPYTNDTNTKCARLSGLLTTRLSVYLRLGLGKSFLQVLEFLVYLDGLADDSKGTSEFDSLIPGDNLVKSILGEIVLLTQCPLVRVDDEQHQFNPDVLEHLVLLAEFVCHACVVLGSSHQLLKSLKASLGRKGKKKREADPKLLCACEQHTCMVRELVTVTQLLSNALTTILPTSNLAKQFEALSVDHDDAIYKVNESLEDEVWKKVEKSYQTSVTELKTLLEHKCHYLDALYL